jgi:hypothetical protein
MNFEGIDRPLRAVGSAENAMVNLSLHAQEDSDTVAFTCRTRTNLALHLLFAACRFAVRIEEVECENSGQPFGPFWEEILHNSLGVVTLTVASLESYANELKFEASFKTLALNRAAKQEIANRFKSRAKRSGSGPLINYATALAVRVNKRLDPSNLPVENAVALIDLRNALVHFRPEWSDERREHDELSENLRYKFKPSAFFPNEPMFPRAWASHDFAAWALWTTVEFLEHFYSEAGVECPLSKFKAQLRELSANVL